MKGLLSTPEVMAVLESATAGGGVSREDARLLIEHAELTSLLRAAAAVRDRSKGRTVGYSKKVFIPLTHLCRDYCGDCTFRTLRLMASSI
jgi:FO synthase